MDIVDVHRDAEAARLQVRRLTGEVLHVHPSHRHTVADLCQELASVWNVPSAQLRLLSSGEVLELSTPLCDLSAEEGIDAIVVSQKRRAFDEGALCEVVSCTTVRTGEDFATPEVGSCLPGHVIEILEAGSGRRRRMKCGSCGAVGWISYKTRFHEPLIAMRGEAMNVKREQQTPSQTLLDYVDVDGNLSLDRTVVLHAKETVNSRIVAVLRKNACVTVLEHGLSGIRVRMLPTGRTIEAEGWLMFDDFGKKSQVTVPFHLRILKLVPRLFCCFDLGPGSMCLEPFQLMQMSWKPAMRLVAEPG